MDGRSINSIFDIGINLRLMLQHNLFFKLKQLISQNDERKGVVSNIFKPFAFFFTFDFFLSQLFLHILPVFFGNASTFRVGLL